MKYLLLTLGVLVVLVVLYLVSRLVKPFGQSMAFACTVMSRLNVKLAEYLTRAADYCHSVCLASLRYPPGVGDSDYWPGVNVLSRLVFFFLAVCVLVGEADNTLIALPALFNTSIHLRLPGGVELASALLFLGCPALLGAVLLEIVGLIPHGAGLFGDMRKSVRWILGIVTALFLLLSMLVLFLFWEFRPMFLDNPDSTQGLRYLILGGLGITVAGVSVFALWALVVGGCGVVSLLMWVVEHVCWMSAASVLFLPSLLDVLAVHLSGGTMSVHGEYIGHDPYKVPTSPFPLFRGFLPGQTVTEDTNGVQIVPVLPLEKEKHMTHPGKTASIVLVGSFGTKMLDLLMQAIARLRATESIFTSLYLDLSVTQGATALPGIVDCSPTQADRKATLLQSETEGQAYTLLLQPGADRLVETHLETKASPAPLLFVLDCQVLIHAVDMLKAIKRRLPLHSLVVVTSLSAIDGQNKSVQAGLAALQHLVAEDVLETVIVTDPHSPFALTYGEHTQLHFLAQTLVSLVIAHQHSPSNRSCTNVFQALHRLSPFTAVSFASEAVAVGTMPRRWSWVPFVSGRAGVGNFSDTLAQTRAAIVRVFTEEHTRAFPAEVSTDSSCILVCTAPYALSDRRFPACVRENALYVSTHYPFSSSLTVRGNGYPYPSHRGSKYLVTASLLSPLHPATFPRLPEGKKQSLTSVFPVPGASEPTNRNGNMHTDPPINEVKQTPPPSAQAKSVAPLSRRGRKNTKAAQ